MLDFHRELLADEVRTDAYHRALKELIAPGDVVLDLGTGSGILAFFACQAGARRVFAAEQQHSADAAILLARHLGFSDRLEVIHQRSTGIDLPEPADLLVTETLGAFGLEERILGNVIDARLRLLRPGARIIPQRLVLSLAPAELPATYAEHVAWWSRPRHGFDLSPLRVFASNVVYTTTVPSSSLLAASADLMTLDLETLSTPDVSGHARFVADRKGLVHGFAGRFTATLAPGIELSNAEAGATHWQQAFLPLEQPAAVVTGTVIDVEVESHDGVTWRWQGTIHSTPPVSFDQMTWLAPPCYQRQTPS